MAGAGTAGEKQILEVERRIAHEKALKKKKRRDKQLKNQGKKSKRIK